MFIIVFQIEFQIETFEFYIMFVITMCYCVYNPLISIIMNFDNLLNCYIYIEYKQYVTYICNQWIECISSFFLFQPTNLFRITFTPTHITLSGS